MTTSNPPESLFPDELSLRTRQDPLLVGESLSLHLTKEQFARIIAYLDTLKIAVDDDYYKAKIDLLLRELVQELSPNEQAAMIRFYLKVSGKQAATFIDIQQKTNEES
tara:strand:+ start:1887 stop:2210 length:324 start_codon:yes stop_codon:yes gene_type:complete